jgi:hypothetical protein
MTARKTKCTERDSVAFSAPPACLGPEGLPTPRRSFVCFRLSVRCETECKGARGSGASDCKCRKALAAGKARETRFRGRQGDRERSPTENEMTERPPFRPLYRRTVASKGFCTSAKLQPTSAGARCKAEAMGSTPSGASDRKREKPLYARKASNWCPRRTSVRYCGPPGVVSERLKERDWKSRGRG